jgi:hypothetical protein
MLFFLRLLARFPSRLMMGTKDAAAAEVLKQSYQVTQPAAFSRGPMGSCGHAHTAIGFG